MPKTLLQKVMKSCQWLHTAWIQSFDAESVANYFLYVYEFRTNDSDIIHAMQRRLFELVCIWLLTSTENKKGIRYSVTDLWVRIDCSKIHLWYTLVLRDNKDDDVSKWWKRKSDKIKKVLAESEAKSENKVLNNIQDWKDIQIEYVLDWDVKEWDMIYIMLNKIKKAQKKLLQNKNEPTHIRTDQWKFTIEEYKNKLSNESKKFNQRERIWKATLIEKEAPKLQPTTLRTKLLSFFTTH